VFRGGPSRPTFFKETPLYVKEYFHLENEDVLRGMKPDFGYEGFGEAVYFRTYSRRKPRPEEGMLPEYWPEDKHNPLATSNWTGQEHWPDTVIRNVNGTFSIRKDWYVKNNIHWDEDYWQEYALGFGEYLFNMYWMPPGRGLWAMGTQFVYDRGSMALNNCGFTKLGNNDTISLDFEWMMDSLMCGVGVGFHAERAGLRVYRPTGTFIFDIPDTREGWSRALKLLIDAFTIKNARKPIFRFHLIRGPGLPIRGFGGLSSGPEPLIKLLRQVEECFNRYSCQGDYDEVRLKTDVANLVGVCVVAGNVRRSAELGMGDIKDEVFLNLKDYDLYPDRASFGWMSNNTAGCEKDEDFDKLSEVSKRVPIRGEPGIANWRNFPKGRIGKKNKGLRRDKARGLNPCGEIPLEDKELCNVSETIPTRCPDIRTWLKACEYAAFYSSTVSLLPTHWSCTNNVVARNRRIGVGIIDYTGWIAQDGLFKVTKAMRRGYKVVTATNQWANGQAGVPEALRKTTVKPGGTVPKLAGRTSGAGYPTFEYILRRMRVAANNPVVPLFRAAGILEEADANGDPNTLVFGFPVKSVGAKAAEHVSLWQQANNLVTLQREWADNSVSNTLYFKPKWVLKGTCSYTLELDALMCETMGIGLDEDLSCVLAAAKSGCWQTPKWKVVLEHGLYKLYLYNPNHEEDDIEAVLASILPLIKACSLLPHSPNGAYKQMPEEGITKEEYERLRGSIQPIDWTTFSGSDGEDEKFCQGDKCDLPYGKKE
jgi:ribonucleoside-triphosphate reductase